jgi:hypothetical protein
MVRAYIPSFDIFRIGKTVLNIKICYISNAHRGIFLAKKGVLVWVFSALTFVAILHLFDAVSAMFFDNQIKLLQLYPLISEELQRISPSVYFFASALTTLILWGITCIIAFDNPVELFLSKMLSEAKEENNLEVQTVEKKSELLDLMNETVLADSLLLGEIKDLTYNIRADVKEIGTLKENIERIKTEINCLKREIKKFEEIKYLKNVRPARDSYHSSLKSVPADTV